MSFKSEPSSTLSRKIITASISGTIFALLLGLIMPDPFDVGISSFGNYMQEFLISVPAYMMYSFPVILIYGTVASTVSDYLASFIANRTHKNLKVYLSFILHVLFGLVLSWFSLLAAVLYFITDTILIKKKVYGWKNALKSLSIPFLVIILFLIIIHILDFFQGFKFYIA